MYRIVLTGAASRMWVPRQSAEDATGKFRSRRRPGLAAEKRTEHRGYSFSITSFVSSSGVSRTRYNVAVYDELGCRRIYLQGYGSMGLAVAAAQDWIDALLASGKR